MELIILLALILGLLYVASPKKPVKVPVRVEKNTIASQLCFFLPVINCH